MTNDDILLSCLNQIDNIVGKSWTFRIILEMRKHQQIRFNELLNLLDGISSSTLTLALKKLHNDGLIIRYTYGIISPLKAGYSLTDEGFDFMIAIYPLLKWAVVKQSSIKLKSSIDLDVFLTLDSKLRL